MISKLSWTDLLLFLNGVSPSRMTPKIRPEVSFGHQNYKPIIIYFSSFSVHTVTHIRHAWVHCFFYLLWYWLFSINSIHFRQRTPSDDSIKYLDAFYFVTLLSSEEALPNSYSFEKCTRVINHNFAIYCRFILEFETKCFDLIYSILDLGAISGRFLPCLILIS